MPDDEPPGLSNLRKQTASKEKIEKKPELPPKIPVQPSPEKRENQKKD